MGFGYNLGFFIGFIVMFGLVFFLPTFIVSRILLKILKGKFIIANVLSILICAIIYTIINPGKMDNIVVVFAVGILNYIIGQSIWFVKDYLDFRKSGSKPFFKKILTASYVTGEKERKICLVAGVILLIATIAFTNNVLAILLSFYVPFLSVWVFNWINTPSTKKK